MTDGLTEAQLAGVEARTDAKFERILGEFRAVAAASTARLDAVAAAMTARIDAVAASTKARIDAVAADFNAKFDGTNARIDSLTANLSDMRSEVAKVREEVARDRNWVIGSVVGTGVAVAGLTIATLCYGSAQFYNGSVIRDLVLKEMQISAGREAIPSSR